MTEYDPVEIQWNNNTCSFKIRTSRLNGREINAGNRYLNHIQKQKLGKKFKGEDSYYCEQCGRTHRILKLEWEKMNIERELKGLPLILRTRPFLIVNELQGKGLHQYQRIEGKTIFLPFRNINRLCFSCNNKYHSIEQEVDSKRDDLPKVVMLSRDSKTSYWEMIDNSLVTDPSVCFKGTMNGYAKVLNVMQDTILDYFNQRYGNDWDLIDITQYNIECNNPHCDKQHIIDPKNPPVYIPTNKEASEQEKLDDLVKKEAKSD